MSLWDWRGAIIALGVLAAAVVGGWFLGADVVASSPGPAAPIVTTSATPAPQAAASATLVLPRVGLSPFGHHSGLPGRQVLVGRVTAVSGDTVRVALPVGDATYQFTQSSFLLRLAGGKAAEAVAGAAVAIVLDPTAPAPTALRLLILPQASRPEVLDQPVPVAPGTDGTDGTDSGDSP